MDVHGSDLEIVCAVGFHPNRTCWEHGRCQRHTTLACHVYRACAFRCHRDSCVLTVASISDVQLISHDGIVGIGPIPFNGERAGLDEGEQDPTRRLRVQRSHTSDLKLVTPLTIALAVHCSRSEAVHHPKLTIVYD